ncbi:MAG: hypothetical protein ACOYOU_21290, partial [Kiritimatiellia bacterium]
MKMQGPWCALLPRNSSNLRAGLGVFALLASLSLHASTVVLTPVTAFQIGSVGKPTLTVTSPTNTQRITA